MNQEKKRSPYEARVIRAFKALISRITLGAPYGLRIKNVHWKMKDAKK